MLGGGDAYGGLYARLRQRRLAARGPAGRLTALRADGDGVALPLVAALAQCARYTSLLDLPGHAPNPRALAAGARFGVLQGGVNEVFNLEWSHDGRYLVCCTAGWAVDILDQRGRCRASERSPHGLGMLAARLRGHASSVNVCRFRDAYSFFTGSDDCTVKLWDLRVPGVRPIYTRRSVA